MSALRVLQLLDARAADFTQPSSVRDTRPAHSGVWQHPHGRCEHYRRCAHLGKGLLHMLLLPLSLPFLLVLLPLPSLSSPPAVLLLPSSPLSLSPPVLTLLLLATHKPSWPLNGVSPGL